MGEGEKVRRGDTARGRVGDWAHGRIRADAGTRRGGDWAIGRMGAWENSRRGDTGKCGVIASHPYYNQRVTWRSQEDETAAVAVLHEIASSFSS